MRRGRECPQAPPAPRITTPMVALAFSVVNSPDRAPECGLILAQMILAVAEGKPR